MLLVGRYCVNGGEILCYRSQDIEWVEGYWVMGREILGYYWVDIGSWVRKYSVIGGGILYYGWCDSGS